MKKNLTKILGLLFLSGLLLGTVVHFRDDILAFGTKVVYNSRQKEIKKELLNVLKENEKLNYEYQGKHEVYLSEGIRNLNIHIHKDGKFYQGEAHSLLLSSTKDDCMVLQVHMHDDDKDGFLYFGEEHNDETCKVVHEHSQELCSLDHEDGGFEVNEFKVHYHEDTGEVHTGIEHNDNDLDAAELLSSNEYLGRIDSINNIMYETVDVSSNVIQAINVDGVSYVNDGVFMSGEKHVQTEIGFNRVEYIKTAWFDCIPYILENMNPQVAFQEGNFYIRLDNTIEVCDLSGFAQIDGETERVLEIVIGVNDSGKIVNVTQAFSIFTETGITTLINTIPDLYPSQSKTNFDWFGIQSASKDGIVLNGSDLAQLPDIVDDAILGTSQLEVQCGDTLVAPYRELEAETYNKLVKESKEVEGSSIYRKGILESDTGTLFYVLNTDGKYVEALDINGEFMTNTLHSSMDVKNIDRYRIAEGYTGDNSKNSNTFIYTNKVLGKEYFIKVNIANKKIAGIQEYSEDTADIINSYVYTTDK